MAKASTVNVRSLGGQPVITVRLERSLVLRIRVGMALMRLGARIATFGYVEEASDG